VVETRAPDVPLSFLTRSPELPTAYADTVVDLSLGWLGAALAAAVILTLWRHGRLRAAEPLFTRRVGR
jgi:hypothetical protein